MSSSPFEIENKINRCLRRCVIGKVRVKPPLVQELERLTRKNREAYKKALQDFRNAFNLSPPVVEHFTRKCAK